MQNIIVILTADNFPQMCLFTNTSWKNQRGKH